MIGVPGLPLGLTARSATFDDAPSVTQLVNFCEVHDLGEPLAEVEDFVAEWQVPSFAMDTCTVCVHDGRELVAYGEVSNGRRAEVDVHPDARGCGLGAALLRWTWEVCRQNGGTMVGQTVPATLTKAISLFQRHGYEQLYRSWILELPTDAALPATPLPAGTSIRSFRPGQDERAAYQVIEDAFNEWPNRVPTSYEDWAAEHLQRPGFEPWQLILAEEGGNVVGACLVSVSSGENWVHHLAVRRDRRRRGIGQALLAAAFGEGRRHGAQRCELSTDSRTGALGLYEHLGMRVRMSFEHWAKQLEDAPLE